VKKTLLAVAVVGLTLVSPAAATVLFSDSLQSTLGAWAVLHDDVSIVPAPGGGNAATWSATEGGGDLTTLNTFTSGTGSFTVTFDTYGNCGHITNCGLFVADTAPQVPVAGWILADTSFASAAVFNDRNNGWEQVSYTFGGSTISLGFENWLGSLYSGPNSFYLRNVALTDNSAGVAVGTLSVTATVTVPANANGQFGSDPAHPGGFVPLVKAITVTKAATITIKYLSGTWCITPTVCGIGPNGIQFNQDSTGGSPLQERVGATFGTITNIGSLIGAFVPEPLVNTSGFEATDGTKLASGIGIMPNQLFFVGTYNTIDVGPGTLYLGINDGAVADNFGSLTVTVEAHSR
jgi:hypothetical protein